MHHVFVMEQSGLESGKPRNVTRLRLLVTAASLTLVFTLFLFVSNYASFVEQVAGTGDPGTVQKADGVVVLTGDAHRIERGIALLKARLGERLLISGVGENTSREAIARTVGEEAAFKGCCIDIEREAKDTIGNARQTADWAHSNGYRSLLVVTSDYHMPRSIMLMRREMPDMVLIPVSANHGENQGAASGAKLFSPVVVREFLKYLSARYGLEPPARVMLSAIGQAGHS